MQVKRVHEFIYHTCLEFEPLSKLHSIVESSSSILTKLLSHGIPSVVREIEERAIRSSLRNDRIMEYIAEEFNCSSELCFPLYLVLQYMVKFEISEDEAVTELLYLSGLESVVCNQCKEIDRKSESERSVKLCRSNSLQHVGSAYPVGTSINISSESSYPSNGTETLHVVESTQKKINEKCLVDISNPFIPSPVKDVYEFEEDVLNDSVIENPFMISEDEDLLENVSPIAHSTMITKDISPKKKSLKCEHCHRLFTNRNNMKVHLIRNVMNVRKFYCRKLLILFIRL